MTQDRHQFDYVQELCGAVRDGEATEEIVAELESLLANDADARQYYVDFMFMHALMERYSRIAEHDEVEPALPSTTGHQPASILGFFGNAVHNAVANFSQGWPLAYLVATVIFGIGLLVGSLVYVSQPVQLAKQSPSTTTVSPKPEAEFVGQITGMVNCQWVDESTAVINGTRVPLARKYALASGLMEITYDTGARVILQGPCTYEVESKDSGYLSVGKVTARLEKKAESGKRKADSLLSTLHSPLFAVRTPTAVVTDLGTEFSVEVDAKGSCEVGVLAGEVVLVSEATGDRRTLRADSQNNAARVDRDGGAIIAREFNKSAFIRQLPRPQARPSSQELVASRFSATPEGWKVIDGGGPCKYLADGGSPDGCIMAIDEAYGPVFYFVAPAKFYGNASAAFGGFLQCDIYPELVVKTGVAKRAASTTPDIILLGGGTELGADLPYLPKISEWNAYSIPLSTAGGWYYVGQEGRPLASDDDIRGVLRRLWNLQIRGEFIENKDSTKLDNVRLLRPGDTTSEGSSK